MAVYCTLLSFKQLKNLNNLSVPFFLFAWQVNWKKEVTVQDMKKYQGYFTSITDLKVTVMDKFKDLVPQSTAFLVDYFEGRQSTKYWICTEPDLNAMCNHCNNEIILCYGVMATMLMRKLLNVQDRNESAQNESRKKQRLGYLLKNWKNGTVTK